MIHGQNILNHERQACNFNSIYKFRFDVLRVVRGTWRIMRGELHALCGVFCVAHGAACGGVS